MFPLKKNLSLFLIWLIITSFYCYQYILRLIPNIIMPELMNKFGINANDFADFAGVYYLGYILMQIPVGFLLSRYGAKTIMPTCIIATALGSISLLTESWLFVLIGRLFIGIGSSASIVGAFQIFRNSFSNSFSRMIGLMVCFGLITAIYISKPLAVLIQNFGIQKVVYYLFFGSVFLAIFTFIFLPKFENNQETQISFSQILRILLNKKLILMSFFSGLLVAPLEGFADAWGSAFLIAIFKIDRISADFNVAQILTGMCVGTVLLPFIADKFKSHLNVTIISGMVMALIFFLLITKLVPENYLFLACLIVGVFSAYQVVIISYISSLVDHKISGMAAAVANMIVMSFGYIFHKMIGLIVHLNANIIQDNMIKYSENSYIKAISVIPVGATIGVIGLVAIKYLATKPNQDRQS